MSEQEKFRVRRPNRMIWIPEIPAGKEHAAWADLLWFVSLIKAERLHSFRLQVNFKSETKKKAGQR